jgi:hypothetical protein
MIACAPTISPPPSPWMKRRNPVPPLLLLSAAVADPDRGEDVLVRLVRARVARPWR